MKDKLRQFYGAFGIDMNQFSIERVQNKDEEMYYLESTKGFSAASRYPMVFFLHKPLGDLIRVEVPGRHNFMLIDLANNSYSVSTKSKYQLAWKFFETKGVDPNDLMSLVKHIKRET